MRQIKSLFFSALGGIALLALVNLTAAYTGANLGWSLFSVGSSVLLGLPGAVALLLFKTLL